MAKFLTDLRNGFWFLPMIVVVVAAGAAAVAVELDSIVGVEALLRYPRLFGAGAEGSRQLLSSIASSTMTVTGVVFSITIVALSLTAAQYSPRVLRNFMSDRPNQLVLGVFVGIYVYCLIVLRTVRGGTESFVPGISVVFALLLALVGVGFLIFFIHHIATSIQVSYIADRVARDTLAVILDTYPEALHEPGSAETADVEALSWQPVAAPATGYIQQVDIDRLVDCAREHGRVVRMEKAVGEFVIKGRTLLSVDGTGASERSFVETLVSAYAINTYRDIRQDPAFGVRQLVEIGLKALSPGINDVGTALNVLDYIAAIVCELAGRRIEHPRYVFSDGKLALIEYTRSFEQMADQALAPLRRAACDNVDMMLGMLETLGELGRAIEIPERRASIMKHIYAIEETLSLRDMPGADKVAVAAALKGASAPESPAVETLLQ